MSRLVEDSQNIRKVAEARNLYTPNDPYNLDNRQVVNTINTLASIIKPFSSFDLTNTILYRLSVDLSNGTLTPISQIGLEMLGKQFTATVISNASADYLPSVKFENLFDGDPSTKFIMRKKDFQITRREGQSNFGKFLEAISGTYDYRSRGYPFDVDANSAQFVKNSGKGQMQILVGNLERNVYKLDDSGFIGAIGEMGLQLSAGNNIIKSRNYFPEYGFDSNFYPYFQYILQNGNLANSDYKKSEAEYITQWNRDGVKEYGGSQTHLNHLGKVYLRDNSDGANKYNFNSYNFGLNDNANEQLVWGRDGATDEYKESLGDLVEDVADEVLTENPRFNNTDQIDKFNIKTGLLNYTKELLNAKGKFGSFDLTRKKFQDTNGQIHFNGSPLDTHPDGTEDYSRRHSMADPYDRYAKAIRFDGNIIYNGNEDSVIYKSVIPKFTPTYNGQTVDNRNMMFSIENLAAEVIKDEDSGVAYINDEMATSLPLCEAGPNGGRVLWFPPYDVRIQETAVARWEHTTLIGRGEPMYNYGSSERIATLSFKMLIDYPPHVIDYRKRGEVEFQKIVSEFFAFGGEASPQFDTNISQKEALLTLKQEQIKELESKKIYIEPNVPKLNEIYLYFPNDYPKEGSEAGNVEDFLYIMGYEDGIQGDAKPYGTDYGQNSIFLANFDKTLSTAILEYFNPTDDTLYNEDNKPYLYIEIEAGATVLYNPTEGQEEYNKALSVRRQTAAKLYIEEAILNTLGRSADKLGIVIKTPNYLALGSTNADSDNNTADTIGEKDAILERYAKISFKRNDVMTTRNLDSIVSDEVDIAVLKEEISALEAEIQNTKRKMVEYSTCIFESPTKDGGYEKGFKSHFNDRFYPVFHTQTPEDFHRRLTFLHQCTRQGPATRIESNGVLSSHNSVFGRQPFCILRFGDFFHTKIIIDQISFDYNESTWDMNPEGRGMQPMIADISIQMRIVGGQSLKTHIDALQNAVSFNYYANSTFSKSGMYATPALIEAEQNVRNKGTNGLSPQELEELEALRASKIGRLSELHPITPESTQ